MTLGEALIQQLEVKGVDTVFGIPGVHTIELYRGLADSAIRHVTPRHEQGAAFMADGYARVSGRPGVCLLITGPGVTNAITAMAQARAERIPMLVISGVNRMESLGQGRGCLHELPDQQALVATVALLSQTIRSAEELPAALDAAFDIMHGPRSGPVHLEIPIDIMEARSDSRAAQLIPKNPRQSDANDEPSGVVATVNAGDVSVCAAERMAEVAAACSGALRPLIVIGGGCVRAELEIAALAESLDAPVVSTTNARGVLARHPLDVPASPSLEAIRRLLDGSDLLIALGTEMGPTDFDMYERGAMKTPRRWIRVDTDPEVLTREPCATYPVRCDAATFARALATSLRDAPPSERSGSASTAAEHGRDGALRAGAARAAALTEIGSHYRDLLEVPSAVWRVLPEATIVGDSTQVVYAGNLYIEAPRPHSWFNSATGFGTLGYAPPAAIGAALADPDRPVVCVVGDGGMQFSLSELGSARDTDANVAFLIWNNGGYLEIENAMTAADVDPVGVTPSAPDFVAIASAYDLPACRVQTVAELESALRELSRPCLVEFMSLEG